MLTVAVSGNAGNPVTYIGDVTGENTDGIGGIVRITGSDNDQAAVRASCIRNGDVQRNYRTFRGFWMDTTAADFVVDNSINCGTNWIIEDCVIQGGGSDAINCGGANQMDWTVRRCILICPQANCINFIHIATVDNVGHLVENCLLIPGGSHAGIVFNRIGGNAVRNCTFLMSRYHIRIQNALAVGQTITVNNCIFTGARTTSLQATAVGEIVENFNTFFRNLTDRVNTNIGANSLTYPPLFSLPLLQAGMSQVSGFKFPWWFGELSDWSQVRELDAISVPEVDLLGLPRPTLGLYGETDTSWGAIEYQDVERATDNVHGGAASMRMADAARWQTFVPVAAEQTTISVWVYREAEYTGPNPRMVLKQPGQFDRVVVDAGPAGQWNQISDTFTPAALPPYLVVELVSLNQTEEALYAGNYDVYWDDLLVS